MIKIPNQMGRQFVALLAYTRDSGKALSAYRDHFFANWRRDRLETRNELTPAMRQGAAAAQDNWSRDNEVSLDEMFSTLGLQLSGREGDSSLIIDRVAEILTSPHAKQMLAGKTLEALKRAVLNPQEITGLDERLQAAEVHCTACHKVFTSGEVITMFHEPTNRGILKPQLYCTKCLGPSYLACSCVGCNEAVALTNKQLAFFAKKNGECEHLKLLKDRAQQVDVNGGVGWGVADLRDDAQPAAPRAINRGDINRGLDMPPRAVAPVLAEQINRVMDHLREDEPVRQVVAPVAARPLTAARWDEQRHMYVLDNIEGANA